MHSLALFLETANAVPTPAVHSLRRRHLLVDGQPLGKRVTCRSGSLWLTFDGSTEDIVLEAGCSHSCTLPGPLVVQALRDAVFSMHQEPLTLTSCQP